MNNEPRATRPGFLRRLARRFRNRTGFHFTRTGLLFLFMVVVLGVAAVNNDANLMLVLFGVGMGTAVVAALMTATGLQQLDVTRLAPAAATEGKPFRIRYRMTNRRRWRRLFSLAFVDRVSPTVADADAIGYVPMIDAQASVQPECTVRPLRRGRLQFDDLRITTRYPLALFANRRRWVQPDEVIVYPAPGRLLRSVWPEASARDVRREMQRATGSGSDEFAGLRDYRQGDNPRWIHWRRSARTGELVVREMAQPRAGTGMVVLDAQLRDRTTTADRETAIRLSATLCLRGLDLGYRIGLIATEDPVVIVPLGGGHRHGAALLRELALLEPRESDFVATLQAIPWPAEWRGAACMLVSASDDNDTRRTADFLAGRCASVNVLSVGTPAVDQVFDPDATVRGAAA